MGTEIEVMDIAHPAFIDLISALVAEVGPASTKGTLLRMSAAAGASVPASEFPTFDAFLAAVGGESDRMARYEGRANYFGDGLFGVPQCPFEKATSDFLSMFAAMPKNFDDLIADFNKPSPMTEKLRIGHGAAASGFCPIHQTLRATAKRVTIGGKPLTVYQLGCKTLAGEKRLAAKWIEAGGWTAEAVEKILDSQVSCYGVKLEA